MILSIKNILLAVTVIVIVILFFGYLIGSYIYKVKHKLPVGDCAGCANKMKKAMEKAKRDIHSNNSCSCHSKD